MINENNRRYYSFPNYLNQNDSLHHLGYYSDYYSRMPEPYRVILSKADLGEQVLSPSNFKLTYPFVNNISDEAVQANVNDAILDLVGFMFRDQVLRPEKMQFLDVFGAYEVPLNQHNLLSILYSLYTFTGGAHGYTSFDSITIDLKTGRIYSFEELFNGKINYKGYINKIAIDLTKKQNVTFIAEYKGITNNQRYYLTPDFLVLYYGLYEYTPYAFGRFEIKIPYSQIINILSPESPIKRLIKS